MLMDLGWSSFFSWIIDRDGTKDRNLLHVVSVMSWMLVLLTGSDSECQVHLRAGPFDLAN